MAFKIFIVSAKTGGHVVPAIISYNKMERSIKYDPFLIIDSKGAKIFAKHIKNTNHYVVKTLKYKIAPNIICNIINIAIGFISAIFKTFQEKPDAIICFGTHLSIGFGIAGFMMRKKIIIHEQNAICSRSNKLLSKFANVITTTFDNTIGLEKYKTINIGMPKNDLINNSQKKSINLQKIKILILGGSQGSKSMSNHMANVLHKLTPDEVSKIKITHQASKDDIRYLQNRYNSIKLQYTLKPFFDNILFEIENADFIISRAGAGAIFDILHSKKPSILIPLPNSMHNHQLLNAKKIADLGASILIKQDNNIVTNIHNIIKKIIDRKSDILKITQNISKIKTDTKKFNMENVLEKLF